MRALMTVLVLALSAEAGAQVVKEMTPARIQEAIKASKKESSYYLSMNIATFATFSTPWSRVVLAARRAREQYKPFTEADVTPEMIAPEVWIIASNKPTTRDPRAYDVERVLVMPHKNKDLTKIIEPLRTIEGMEQYSNLMGASSEHKRITAIYPLSVLSEANEVHVIYDAPVCMGGFMELTPTVDCTARFKMDKVR